jgi:hypothetical protein
MREVSREEVALSRTLKGGTVDSLKGQGRPGRHVLVAVAPESKEWGVV